MPFEFSEKFEKSALKKGESDAPRLETKPMRSIDDLRHHKQEGPEDMNDLINRRLNGVKDSSERAIKTGEQRFNQIAESSHLEDKGELEKTKQETREKLDGNNEEIENLSAGAKQEILHPKIALGEKSEEARVVEEKETKEFNEKERESIFFRIKQANAVSEFRKNTMINMVAKEKGISPDTLLNELRFYAKNKILERESGPLRHYHRTSIPALEAIAESGALLSRSKLKEKYPETKLQWSAGDNVMMTRDKYDREGNLVGEGLSKESVGNINNDVVFVFNKNIINLDDYDAIGEYPAASNIPLKGNCEVILVNDKEKMETVKKILEKNNLPDIKIKAREEWEQENASEARERKRPGGAVPEYSLWEPRIEIGKDGQKKEKGVRAPDGTYYKLEEGERFVINKGEKEDYEAVIIGPNGEERILRKSLEQEKVEREQPDKEKIEAIREQLGISQKTESGIETRESRELNGKVKIAAEYLNRLDHYAEIVQVDPNSGKIVYEKPKLEELTDENVKKYQGKFTELIRTFTDRNKAYMEALRRDPNILDIKEVAGAIVATYDSSKGIPKMIREEMLSEDDNDIRGKCGKASEKYLGFVIVDINKEKRKDGVSPSVSAVHELNHHMLYTSDYLMSQDEALNMQSAYRNGRSTALYGSGKDRIPTNQAFLNDKEQYSKLLGREFNLQTELPRVEAQSSYLDELHSSYLQRKENWFNAQENVYSTKKKGKHWELVGDHPEDIEASKKMLGYLQGFYTLDKIREDWQQRLDSGQQLGEGQKKFLTDCAEEFRRVGSLIGASRTIKQAEMLVAESWKSFVDKNPRITTTAEFSGMLDQWEKGAGVENLRTIISKEKV